MDQRRAGNDGARVTTALIGASRVQQIADCVAAMDKPDSSREELDRMYQYASESGINLWAPSSDHG